MIRHISWTSQFHTWTPTEILLRSQETRGSFIRNVLLKSIFSRQLHRRLDRRWRMCNSFSALSAKVCAWKTHLSHFYILQTTMKFGEVNVFPWSIFYGKQTFPCDASLRVCSENACTTANLNIVDLVKFYGCLCSLCYWKHFTEQFKGTPGR